MRNLDVEEFWFYGSPSQFSGWGSCFFLSIFFSKWGIFSQLQSRVFLASFSYQHHHSPRPKIQIRIQIQSFDAASSRFHIPGWRLEKVLPTQTNEGIQLFFLSGNHFYPSHTHIGQDQAEGRRRCLNDWWLFITTLHRSSRQKDTICGGGWLS